MGTHFLSQLERVPQPRHVRSQGVRDWPCCRVKLAQDVTIIFFVNPQDPKKQRDRVFGKPVWI